MRFPVFKENLIEKFNISQSNSYQSTNNKLYTSENTKDEFIKQQNRTSSKKKLTVGASILIALSAIVTFLKLKKNPQKTFKETKPLVKNMPELINDLIDKNKPKDIELAKNVYAKLFKNSEKLNLASEHFDKVLDSINPKNKEFIVEEGIELIADKFEKIQPLIEKPNDFSPLISTLNKENKNIFISIIEDISKFKITDIDDLCHYLKNIESQNLDYILNKLMPELQKYEKPLKLDLPYRYTTLFKKITPETMDMISTVATAKDTTTVKIPRFSILSCLNGENKEVVKPLLENFDKLKYTSDDILTALKTLKNEQASTIEPVARNLENIQQRNLTLLSQYGANSDKNILDVNKILKLKVPKEKVPFFNKIIGNLEEYKIEDVGDIAYCIKQIPQTKVDFVHNELLPKLATHSNVLGIQHTHDIVNIAQNITPNTLDSIDEVVRYAKEIGLNISDDFYPNLLSAVTIENKKNIAGLLKNIRQTDDWEKYLNIDDFRELLK